MPTFPNSNLISLETHYLLNLLHQKVWESKEMSAFINEHIAPLFRLFVDTDTYYNSDDMDRVNVEMEMFFRHYFATPDKPVLIKKNDKIVICLDGFLFKKDHNGKYKVAPSVMPATPEQVVAHLRRKEDTNV